MYVLLVEPDSVQSQIYSAALALDGHTVTHARSAQTAVRCADAHKPDVVVLELQLSRHNGVEFLYEFRSYPEWLDVPIVIHSFVPPSELARMPTLTGELGVKRILYKPDTTLAGLRLAIKHSSAVVPS